MSVLEVLTLRIQDWGYSVTRAAEAAVEAMKAAARDFLTTRLDYPTLHALLDGIVAHTGSMKGMAVADCQCRN